MFVIEFRIHVLIVMKNVFEIGVRWWDSVFLTFLYEDERPITGVRYFQFRRPRSSTERRTDDNMPRRRRDEAPARPRHRHHTHIHTLTHTHLARALVAASVMVLYAAVVTW